MRDIEGEDGWIRALPLDELLDRTPVQVVLDGVGALIVRDGERLFAIGNRCPHQGAPLHRGRVTFGSSLSMVTCPVHGSMFDLSNGAVRRGPASAPVPAYDARVVDGVVEIRARG